MTTYETLVRPLVAKCGYWTILNAEELKDEQIMEEVWADYSYNTHPTCEHDVQRDLEECKSCDEWDRGTNLGKEIAKGDI